MQPKNADSRAGSGTIHREGALAGRVVVITGAASGIGRGVALECGRQGARLALADISPELIALGDELRALGLSPADVLIRELDVAARSEVFAWAAEIERELGPASGIVNAAGVSLHCPLDETTSEDFDWVMQTNFWGTVHGTQAFLPQLQKRGHGHIVNVSSVFGLLGFPASGAYSASKFAVRGFTETLSIEMALTHPGIVVTCVHPGGVKTPLVRRGRVRGKGPLARTHEEAAQAFDRSLARTSPEECARKIVRILSGRRRRLLIGPDAFLIDAVVRLFPSSHGRLLTWILRRNSAQSSRS